MVILKSKLATFAVNPKLTYILKCRYSYSATKKSNSIFHLYISEKHDKDGVLDQYFRRNCKGKVVFYE